MKHITKNEVFDKTQLISISKEIEELISVPFNVEDIEDDEWDCDFIEYLKTIKYHKTLNKYEIFVEYDESVACNYLTLFILLNEEPFIIEPLYWNDDWKTIFNNIKDSIKNYTPNHLKG